MHGSDMKCVQNFSWKWKRPLGTIKRRWEDNIRMDLKEAEWKDVNWMNLVQDGDQRRAVVSKVMKLRVP
jgi:hypothetical protein